MPRKAPPPGYITSSQALEIIGPMLYKYVKRGLLKRHIPPTGTYGYYKLSEVEKLHEDQRAFYERGDLEPENTKSQEQEHHHMEFMQATPDDMQGVYEVAAKVFSHSTSSAAIRRPLVEKCPEGNYVVKDNGQVVAFMHLQPLKPDRLKLFMQGKIRGWELTADDVECFVPGKPAECLLKSIGSYHEDEQTRLNYMLRLLMGAKRELEKLGQKGIIITKIYGTSETETGIAMSIHAKMQPLGKIGPERYAFMLDIASSDLPLLQPYKRALAEWQASHPGAIRTLAATQTHEGQFLAPASHSPPISRKPSESQPRSQRAPLPEGYASVASFAQRHGIHENTAKKAVGSGRLTATKGEWIAGRAPVTSAFDQEQQRAFLLLYRDNPNFHQCDDPGCRCHQLGSEQ